MSLGMGFLLYNQQVSRKTNDLFYRRNTFRIMGYYSWHALYSFLETIGPVNRQILRSLEIQMRQPKHIWQYPDGTCTSMTAWPFREVIAQSRYAQNCTPLTVGEGGNTVEHLDPAIEACFRILGKNRPPLQLVLLLDIEQLPGVELSYDEQHPDDDTFTMDVPLMIERCRQDLTASHDGTSRVEILWKGEFSKRGFIAEEKLVQENGWAIIEAEERINDDVDEYCKYTIMFTLRLKDTSVNAWDYRINKQWRVVRTILSCAGFLSSPRSVSAQYPMRSSLPAYTELVFHDD